MRCVKSGRTEVIHMFTGYQYLYVEINLLCILLLSYELHGLLSSLEQQAENIALRRVVAATIAVMALDALWSLGNGAAGQTMSRANGLVMSLYLIMEGVVAYCWLQYVEIKLGCGRKRPLAVSVLLQLPMLALIIFSLGSIWNGWMFYYDANNVYHRGAYFFLQPLFPASYLALSCIETLVSVMKDHTRKDSEDQKAIFVFLVFPLAGFLAGIFCEGLPMIWPLASIGLLYLFMALQNHKISTDSLTGTNNRREFDKRFAALTADPGVSRSIGLLLMDIDAFKSINDTYGHAEGDLALIEASAILRGICESSGAFLARYGGDEFAILFPYCEEDAASLRAQIENAFAQRNAQSAKPYDITLSIGGAGCDSGLAAASDELIRQADRELYREKSGKKLDR